MRWFLHFVGKTYYTMDSFRKEAEKFGVSRRISLRELKQMAWGDRVLLAMLKGKTPVVFGYFVVERIGGLSPEVTERILQKYSFVVVDFGGHTVHRGCGVYYTGTTYRTTASIQEIAAEIEAAGEKSPLMVMGRFHPHELVRLPDIPFRQGFRLFDYETFQKSIKPRQRGLPVARGQFYVSEKPEVIQKSQGEIQTVVSYKRKEK